ncbi:MAG TPA: hypothetical protein VGN95_17360, partial [Pyrinomonadaceae bacterium]|nr:hypothetical protein [Pyrinomonadaceae bacterium]
MIWSRLKEWYASLKRVGGIELPDDGRSSVESTLSGRIGATLDSFGSVSPVIDFELLRCLKHLWLFNPDLSQYVTNIVNLGNTGHQITVDARNSSLAEAALARINESAYRLYPNGAGVDGLLNAYLAQIAWSGALSSEDVVDFRGRRVSQVVLVPVEEIRFCYLEGQYVPHQQPRTGILPSNSSMGMIRLNPETYHYFALQTVENSPYAKPPASAAVNAITGPQTDMLENIKYIAKKLGILGLVSVACTPPPKQPNESIPEYNTRAQKYLSSVRKVFDNNFVKGLLVHFRDQKIEHSNVASDARGAYEVWRMNEEQVMSGTAMPPAFFGRTDSTTETYAGVVYHLLTSQVSNIQRLAKRRQEATYRLDLSLAGIEVDGLSLSFNRAHVLNPLQDAQAEQIGVTVAIQKARAGIISPDEAAQEMGYDSAFDPELLSSHPEAANSLRRMKVGAGRASESMTATFRFDRSAQRYKFAQQVIELSGATVEA